MFIALHGLTHLWFVALSQRLIPFDPAMGWTGKSWLLSGVLGDQFTRSLASALFVLAAIALVISGAGVVFMREAWWRPLLIGSALLSALTIVLFWDGRTDLLVQRGAVGLAIDAAILVALFAQTARATQAMQP